MGVKEHKCHALKSVKCAIITMSDTRTVETDESGKYILESLKANGHEVVSYMVLKENVPEIQKEVQRILQEKSVQAIITNGGTGVSKRDITIEAMLPQLEKTIDGFGEIFRALSYKEIGSAAIMSRAIAGTCRGVAIFCLPGSINAVKLAMDKLIIPELGHIVWELSK
ncbi:MAG: MogA/MoaB family molybdenum cofactor biosynthesis protein [Thermoplasmata archaeon]